MTAWVNPGAKERQRILAETRSVAVVGASPNPARASYFVMTYLLAESDYRLYPVNPSATEILGLKVAPNLEALPEVPDVVDVFRRADQAGAHVDEAIALGARAVWLQLGVIDDAAAQRARDAGLLVVMDRCPKIEWR